MREARGGYQKAWPLDDKFHRGSHHHKQSWRDDQRRPRAENSRRDFLASRGRGGYTNHMHNQQAERQAIVPQELYKERKNFSQNSYQQQLNRKGNEGRRQRENNSLTFRGYSAVDDPFSLQFKPVKAGLVLASIVSSSYHPPATHHEFGFKPSVRPHQPAQKFFGIGNNLSSKPKWKEGEVGAHTPKFSPPSREKQPESEIGRGNPLASLFSDFVPYFGIL